MNCCYPDPAAVYPPYLWNDPEYRAQRLYTGDVPMVAWSEARIMDNIETHETAIAVLLDDDVRAWMIRGPGKTRLVILC